MTIAERLLTPAALPSVEAQIREDWRAYRGSPTTTGRDRLRFLFAWRSLLRYYKAKA